MHVAWVSATVVVLRSRPLAACSQRHAQHGAEPDHGPVRGSIARGQSRHLLGVELAASGGGRRGQLDAAARGAGEPVRGNGVGKDGGQHAVAPFHRAWGGELLNAT